HQETAFDPHMPCIDSRGLQHVARSGRRDVLLQLREVHDLHGLVELEIDDEAIDLLEVPAEGQIAAGSVEVRWHRVRQEGPDIDAHLTGDGPVAEFVQAYRLQFAIPEWRIGGKL